MELKVGGFYLTKGKKVVGPLIKNKADNFTTVDLNGRIYWGVDGVCVITYGVWEEDDILEWSIKHELIIKELTPKMGKKTYIVKGSLSKSFDCLNEAEKWARDMSQKNPSHRWTIYAEEQICYYECPSPQPVRTAL